MKAFLSLILFVTSTLSQQNYTQIGPDPIIAPPEHVQVGDVARSILSPEDIEFFENLPIPEDNRANLQKDSSPVQVATQATKDRLMYLGTLAGAAYCTKESIIAWDCGNRCQSASGIVVSRHFYNEGTDVRGFIGLSHAKKEIYIVFKGSSSIKNWIYNLYASMTTVPWKLDCLGIHNPLIHEGFLLGYESVSSIVSAAVRDTLIQNPEYSIVTIGHSMGGALAVICAMELNTILKFTTKIRTATFECPRIGNEDFVKLFLIHFPNPEDRYRVTNGRDIVLRLPPYNWGFRHTPQEFFIPVSSNSSTLPLQCNAVKGEDPACSNAYWAFSIDDHLNYPWGIEFGAPCRR